MKRRNFLKGIVALSAAVTVAPSLLGEAIKDVPRVVSARSGFQQQMFLAWRKKLEMAMYFGEERIGY